MIIAHLNKLWNYLVDRGAYHRTHRQCELKFDYVFDCGTLFDGFAARF